MVSTVYNIRHRGFWKSYWITLRPYLMFVSGSAGLVGLAFVPHPETLRTITAFFIFFLSYGFGQALTDCFQTDTDSISSPYRPLVQGRITRNEVLAVSLAGLLGGALILAVLNPWILLPGLLCVAGLATYTVFKRTWWGGPPWNSWIVALLAIIARMTDPGAGLTGWLASSSVANRPFFFAVAAVFFAYLNFVVMGYLKDISADAATGYHTFPVTFGWLATAIYSDVAATLAALFTLLTLLTLPAFSVIAILIFAIGLLLNTAAQLRIHRIRDEQLAFGPIEQVVRVFVLYALSVVVALRSSWLLPSFLFVLLFELNMKTRPEKKQV